MQCFIIKRFWFILIILLIISQLNGCTSSYFRKGVKAYNLNKCREAYALFRKVPGSPEKGSRLSDKLSKSLCCIADKLSEDAADLKSEADNLEVPQAKKRYNDALNLLEKAISTYEEAVQYAELHKKGSALMLQNKLTRLTALKKRYLKKIHKRESSYFIKSAAMDIERGDYENAVLNYSRALIPPDRYQFEEKKDYIAEQFRIVKCQYIRDEMASGNWDRARRAVTDLENLPFQERENRQIKNILQEFNIAYCNYLMEESEEYFHKCDIVKARRILKKAVFRGDSRAEKRLQKLRQYHFAVDAAIGRAVNEFEEMKKTYNEYLTPEQACAIEVIQMKPFEAMAKGKILKKWLQKKEKAAAESLHAAVHHVLAKAFLINKTAQASVTGIYHIAVENGEQWVIQLELRLQNGQQVVFHKTGTIRTDRFDLFSGWGPFRKVREDQTSVLLSSLQSLAKSTAEYFIPFSRCKGQTIISKARKYLFDSLNGQLDPADRETLKRLIIQKSGQSMGV